MNRLSFLVCVTMVVLVSLIATSTGQRVRWQAANSIYDNDDVGILAVEMMTKSCQEDPTIPGLAGELGLTDLVKLVQVAGLAPTLSGPGHFTVFGPTNKAISAIPKWLKQYISNQKHLAQFLRYHVLSSEVKSSALSDELIVTTDNDKMMRVNLYPKGQKQFKVATVQCAPIDLSRVDKQASNGVVHVINNVMIPPYGAAALTLSVCPVFQNLTNALKTAKLADTLNGPGPYTIFAPTDQAFSKLPAGTLDKLMHNMTALAEVLKYHVVSGTYCSAGLTSGTVKTLNSKEVQVKVAGDVRVNGVKVIQADASITNGVVHVIEGVLIPPGFYI